LKRRRVVLVHVLPNALSPLLVIISVSLGFAVLAEAALSYLGFGVQPPTPSWGGMLSDASKSLSHQYLVYAPGILLALTIAAFTVMADVVRKSVSGRKETDRG